MKTILALVSLAALGGFAVLPFNFETSVSLLFATGFAVVVVTDYSRPARSLLLSPALARSRSRRPEGLRLAA